MKKIFLINHSHTDIGYTAVQETIIQYHVDYIEQALKIIEEELKQSETTGFVWTCENYWQVENFLAEAEPEKISQFEQYVEAGYIDFGKNYLNMTELVDGEMLNDCLEKGDRYSRRFARVLNSAMTADINGFSWSYCDALLKNGTKNLFACVHGHHGIYPLFKNQLPFWWESTEGERLLVWSGEHYHFGNELGLMPDAQTTYQIRDEFSNDFKTEQLLATEQRVFRYVEELTESGYTLPFIPIMISGFISDNAGPNERILAFLDRWNDRFGDQITIEMIGLNDFFKELREQDLSELPSYRGDWNDWWADGVGSTPAATKIYKDAVRKYRLVQALSSGEGRQQPLVQAAQSNLVMYAEHTWGYSSSVSEPWNTLVNELEYRKAAYAVNGSRDINTYYNRLLMKEYGYSMPRANRPQHFKVINPYDEAVTQSCKLLIEYWEHLGEQRITEELIPYLEVYDRETGQILPNQTQITARAFEVEIAIALEPKEIRQLGVRVAAEKRMEKTYRSFVQGAEGVTDILYPGKVNDYEIQTRYFDIKLSNRKGIGSLIYRPTGENLLDEAAETSLFMGIYEKTPIQTDPCQERRRMGRNRKGKQAERWFSAIQDIRIVERGPVYTSLQMDCKLEGTQMYTLFLKIYEELAKIDCTLRLQKDNEWAPENVYVSLPVALSGERFVKKSGNLMRPAIDQLPGTNTEFYLLDTGVLYLDEKGTGLGLCLRDTPLITMGTLENHPIELCSDESRKKNQAPLYSWIMNNYWETNFKVDLSGFYEFSYTLLLENNLTEINQLDQKLNQIDQGIIVIPVD